MRKLLELCIYLVFSFGIHNPSKWILLGYRKVTTQVNGAFLLCSFLTSYCTCQLFASSLKSMRNKTGLIPWNRIAFQVEQMSFLYSISRESSHSEFVNIYKPLTRVSFTLRLLATIAKDKRAFKLHCHNSVK